MRRPHLGEQSTSSMSAIGRKGFKLYFTNSIINTNLSAKTIKIDEVEDRENESKVELVLSVCMLPDELGKQRWTGQPAQYFKRNDSRRHLLYEGRKWIRPSSLQEGAGSKFRDVCWNWPDGAAGNAYDLRGENRDIWSYICTHPTGSDAEIRNRQGEALVENRRGIQIHDGGATLDSWGEKPERKLPEDPYSGKIEKKDKHKNSRCLMNWNVNGHLLLLSMRSDGTVTRGVWIVIYFTGFAFPTFSCAVATRHNRRSLFLLGSSFDACRAVLDIQYIDTRFGNGAFTSFHRNTVESSRHRSGYDLRTNALPWWCQGEFGTTCTHHLRESSPMTSVEDRHLF